MLRNVLFVRKFVEKANKSSFPLGNEIQVAQPVHGGPRGTKWGLHNLYFDWASSSRATDNVHSDISRPLTPPRNEMEVAQHAFGEPSFRNSYCAVPISLKLGLSQPVFREPCVMK